MRITKRSSESQWGIHGAYTLQEEQVNHLIGELLTVVDAIGLKESQEKSVKDIIKQKVWSNFGSSDYLDGRIIVLARDIEWELKDLDNQKYFSQSKEKREKGLHELPVAHKGEYELTFISEN